MSQTVLSIGAYCLSSILMTLTNKLVLSSFDFKMNFLFLAFQRQSVGCVALLELFTVLGLTRHRSINAADAATWVRVTVSLVLMIYTGSKAIQYLSIPVFTIFKNLTIVLIAYLEKYLLAGSNITRPIFFSFVLMVLSSIVAGYADISAGNTLKPGAVSAVVSYSWMVFNCLSTAALTLTIRSTQRKVNFTDFDTVYYNNLLSIPMLVGMSLLVEWQEGIKTYDRYFGPQSADNAAEFTSLMSGIVISSVCTFMIAYCTSWCIRITGATTYSMVGALNKLPIAVFGMVFFDAVVSPASVLSVLIAFFAGGLYSWAKSRPTGPVLPTYTKVEAELK
ncbi:GDP-mannose transporter into the lumen of the Golgi [Kappamyces sp. JEL0829]|nr:GDP-mannose transporter into the lumen of the Golgi [Kappamyces sp. JEL0829]